MTLPDLAFAFAELSKFVQAPGQVHMRAAKRMLAYLKGTMDEGITFYRPKDPADVNRLHGWVDSDYAADPDNRRSTTGFLLTLNNGPISWKAKRQACTTLSSAEAEFVAASMCGQEVIYLRNLLRDLGHPQTTPTQIYEDNASCIAMSENPANPKRSRHIDTRMYFLRDMVRDGLLKLRKVAGTRNVADALTKSLPAPSFHQNRTHLWGLKVPFEAFHAHIARFPATRTSGG